MKAGISAVLAGSGLLRIASSAGGVLIGLYLADLARQGRAIDAGVVGALGAVTFVAELLAAVPMGVLADRWTPRALMVAGGLLGALATQLFGMSGAVSIFFLTRVLEGIADAAGGPPTLAHLTDVTEDRRGLRVRVMSFYELTLLASIALGGLAGSLLWKCLRVDAFAAVAGCYLLSSALLWLGARQDRARSAGHALSGLRDTLRNLQLLRFAPAWLCMNVIVSLWLGPTLPFLFTAQERGGQYLTGLFTGTPEQVGVVTLLFALVFSTGVALWSIVLPRMQPARVLQLCLLAMAGVCLTLYLLNHSQGWPPAVRWFLIVVGCISVLGESGFTPAGLLLLSDAVGAQRGRGAAMGIYTVLLSAGSIGGNLGAGVLGRSFGFDGLIFGTVAMAALAYACIGLLPRHRSHTASERRNVSRMEEALWHSPDPVPQPYTRCA